MKPLVHGLIWTLTAVVAAGGASSAPPPSVPVPPSGSVFAPWTYTHDQLQALVPKARPADVSSPAAIVTALHESVNGPQGKWNSDRLRSLCLPNVLFASLGHNDQGQPTISNRPLASFIKDVQDVHDTTGCYEHVSKIIDVSTVSDKANSLAVVHYEGVGADTPDGPPTEQGETQASLMFDGQRWWVASDTW
jgi:hypothetical protein